MNQEYRNFLRALSIESHIKHRAYNHRKHDATQIVKTISYVAQIALYAWRGGKNTEASWFVFFGLAKQIAFVPFAKKI